MCTVCGCGQDDAKPGDRGHDHGHSHHHGNNSHDRHFGTGAAGLDIAGFSQQRLIEIETDILSKNDAHAEANRRRLGDRGLFAVNLLSSPGAGKTTLLVETVKALREAVPVGVIEGDQQTANDADRIRATGVPAVQINTGSGCHLDAHMVGHALDGLAVPRGGVVFIENVGNLVCPAAFDLGEAFKIVILSVTEGDDKPIKYPDMFAAADLMILSKMDLLEHVDFDPEHAVELARRVNPDIEVMRLSAKSGVGMTGWRDWILARAAGHASVAAE
ncbi:MAG: hydrogenase nickel incorporation protein HypB [Alphaproteobacteria bacterium]